MGIVDRLFGRRPQRPVPPVPAPASAARPFAAESALARGEIRPTVTRPGVAKPSMLGAPPRQHALREVFTPTRPQRSLRRVAGRQVELLRIFRAIALDRAHVVLYGERGRGKTSLVNLVAAAARSAGYMVGRVACASDSDFEAIMRGLARDLPASLLAAPATADSTLEGCEAALPPGRLQPRDIAGLPGRLSGKRLVLIADEFDRVEDTATRTILADTIKQVSDRGAALSFVVVGVSDSLEELLGRHPSIQRNILGLPLPLLSDQEIGNILEQARRDVGISFPPEIQQEVAAVARGVPYMAQLLGLHAGVETMARDAAIVSRADLQAAFGRAVDEADPHLATLYQALTRGGRDRAMREALAAIAGGAQDRFGRFAAFGEPDGHRVAERAIDPELWQRLIDGAAVRPCPSAGPDRFTFADALFRHYVLMREALERPQAAAATAPTGAEPRRPVAPPLHADAK